VGISGNISAVNGAAVTYDGLRRGVRNFVTDGSVSHDNYYTASWQLAEVRKNSDADPLDQYVWGLRYIDAAVVRFHDDNTDGIYSADLSDLTLYYVNDANMNLTLLMDEGAKLRGRFAYDAYGKPLFLKQSWTVRNTQATHRANPIHYAGYHYAEEIGLYNVRHRTYNPTLGRWMQKDPKDRMYGPTVTGGYQDGMSLYEYVMGSAVNYLDPLGLGCKDGDVEIVIDDQDEDDIQYYGVKLTNAFGLSRELQSKSFDDYYDDAVDAVKKDVMKAVGGALWKGAKSAYDKYNTRLRLIVSGLASTGNAFTFQIKYEQPIKYRIRKCECKCRRLWVMWCIKYG
jgi:RHS repeat-associated protein